MPWSGWPTTQVSQLTFSEWQFALRPKREVLAGYTLSYLGVWHVFGDDNWVWFNGAIRGSWGAVEIVSQWAEVENLAVSWRHWRWVHWRNPSNETVYVAPRFLLAPPLDDRALRIVDQQSRVKRIWTLVDVASNDFAALGLFTPADEDEDRNRGGSDEGGGGDGGGGNDGGGEGGGSQGIEARGVLPGIALRTLEGQRLTTVALRGDERFLPIEELDARVQRLVDRDKYRE